MLQSTPIPEIIEIKKGLNRLGLTLSESELHELELGNTVSLEGIGLSEIGSIFILASAVYAVNLGKTKAPITFRDLPKVVKDSACCSGISIYCWNSDSIEKRCLYLTLVGGNPAICTCCSV